MSKKTKEYIYNKLDKLEASTPVLQFLQVNKRKQVFVSDFTHL